MAEFKFSIDTLGCKTNQSESDYIIGNLQKRGFILATHDQKPFFCIINTCTVTSKSDKKVRQVIRKIRSKNPDSIIMVTGCFITFNHEFLKENKVDYIVKNKDKNKISDLVEKLALEMHKGIILRDGFLKNARRETILNSGIHSRPLIKIQDGCEQNCSYCIVPKVRGVYKSINPDIILENIKNLEEKGFEEVVLTGIHVGKYGVDFNNNDFAVQIKKLSDLLEYIIYYTGIKRFRLSSIEINEIDEKIIDLIKNSKRISPHLHIPLQSGSNKILRLMGRPYSGEYFLKKTEDIKSEIPSIAITTDVMAGFCGEEEEDFKKTVDLVKKINFSKLHVFKYSPRPHTCAYFMKDQISEKIKSERSRSLRELGNDLRKNYIKENIGENLKVLIERIDNKKRTAEGISQNYIKVYFGFSNSSKTIRKGKLVNVVGKQQYKDGILGEICYPG